MNFFNIIKKVFMFSSLFFYMQFVFSKPNHIKLWENTTLHNEKSKLYVFEPADSLKNGIVAIICPGGSYQHLMGIQIEGFEVAQWLNKQGITAFVLEYRVNKNFYHHPAMIEDIQKAINYVRTNVDKYKINPDKLGVIGFSAGGHLSLMSGIFYGTNYLEKYGIKDSNLKPNFIVPVYPVVSMQDSIAHIRSRRNLLGNNITKEDKDKFSMELQVSDKMSPALIVVAKDDPVVNYRNSINLYQNIEQKAIKNCKLLFYETGGHGFGLNDTKGGEAAKWKYSLIEWLKSINIL